MRPTTPNSDVEVRGLLLFMWLRGGERVDFFNLVG